MTAAALSTASISVTAVLVPAQLSNRLVVAFGDSITDGDGSTVDADNNCGDGIAWTLAHVAGGTELLEKGEIPNGGQQEVPSITLDVKAGDRVLFGKWSGTEVKIDGQDYLIMKESDLLGVVDKPSAWKAAA